MQGVGCGVWGVGCGVQGLVLEITSLLHRDSSSITFLPSVSSRPAFFTHSSSTSLSLRNFS